MITSPLGVAEPTGGDQIVTIPANSSRECFMSWLGTFTPEDRDKFSKEKWPVQVSGSVQEKNKEAVRYCYKYYRWDEGERPNGIPEFVPWEIDPTRGALHVYSKMAIGGKVTEIKTIEES